MAALAVACFFASLNGPATGLLFRIGVDPWLTAEELAIAFVACAVVAASPTLRGWGATVYNRTLSKSFKVDQIDRQNNFDALRLAFAIFVLCYHSWALTGHDTGPNLPRFLGVTLGVPLFFVLSGYLIVRSWEGSRSVFDYLRRRVLRIFPAFIVVCVVCAVAAPLIGGTVSWPTYILRTLILNKPQIAGAFAHNLLPEVNGSLWTIQIEFACYLAVILLGMIARRSHTITFTILFVIAFIAMGCWRLGVCPFSELQASWLRFVFSFLIGAMAYLWRGRLFYCLPIGILLVCVLPQIDAPMFVPLTYGYLALCLAFAPELRLNKITEKVGDLSYGCYAWAFFIQQALIALFHNHISPWPLFGLSLPLSLIIAYGSWHLIEKQALRFKTLQRPLRHQVVLDRSLVCTAKGTAVE